MGNENSKTHTHGLHFKASCLNNPKGLKLSQTKCIVVEFDGLAFTNKKNDILYRPKYSEISAWGASPDNKRMKFEFHGDKSSVFKVDNAKVVEHAMLLRLDVFRTEDKFAATTVSDPSGKFAEEVIFHVTGNGLVVSDATGRTKPRLFEFVMLQGWGSKNGYEIILQTRDSTQYTFASPSVKEMLAKLDDVARMVARSLKAKGAPVRESIVDQFHTQDETYESPLTLVKMVFNPFGENVLPKDCAVRCLDGQGVRILGVGTKKKITVKYESLGSWSHDSDHVTLTLTPEKGSKSFVLKCNSVNDAANLVRNLEQSLHRYDHKKQKRRNARNSINVVHQAPDIPNSLAQVGKLKSRRLSGSDKTLKVLQQRAQSGQNLFAGVVGGAQQQQQPIADTDNFQMEAQVGRHGEILGLEQSSSYLIVVDGSSSLKLINMSASVVHAVHSWKLNQITGWQAIDRDEFMLVIPQGKVSFFVEDAHILASVIEDACLKYAKELKSMRQQQSQLQPSAPLPPHPMQQHQQQQLQEVEQQFETVSLVIPKGVKSGHKMKVKLQDGSMKEFTVPPGAKVGQQVDFQVPRRAKVELPDVISMTIPPGVKPGNKLKVKLDDGSMREFVVPPGSVPGQQIEFKVR